MIVTEIVLVAIGGLVAVSAALYKALERSIPCNSCEYLVKRGGAWQYTCKRDTSIWGTDSFDTPPKYCKYYKPMEEAHDQ